MNANGSGLCVVALNRNLILTTTLNRDITQSPCYVPLNFNKMEIAEIKKTVTEIRNKAIDVACALKGYKREDCYETVFEEDNIEVVFYFGNGCGCFSDEEVRVYLKYEQLAQDIEVLKKEKEQQQLQEKLKKDEAEKLRKQKEAEEKKKREEEEYLRLKKKFESA